MTDCRLPGGSGFDTSSPGGPPMAHAATHEPGGSDTMAVDAAIATGSLRTVGQGTAVSACADNDARLSDARTPTAHSSSHSSGGSDPFNVSQDTTPSLGGHLDASNLDVVDVRTLSFEQELDLGDKSGSWALSFATGQNEKCRITANATVSGITFPTGGVGHYQLRVENNGAFTLAWPAAIKWPGGTAPTLTSGAGKFDIFNLYYDGTNTWAQAAQDFS